MPDTHLENTFSFNTYEGAVRPIINFAFCRAFGCVVTVLVKYVRDLNL